MSARPVYDHLARFYDRAFAPFEARFLGDWRREALSQLPETGRILEIGCGTGRNFSFYPANCQAVSTELSFNMLEYAAGRLVGNKLLQADAEKLPFGAAVFDAAFATLVFCSVSDPGNALREALRVLVPGGSLILLEHVRPPGFLGCVFEAITPITVASIDDHFDRRTAELVASAGFELVEVRSKARGAVNLIIARKPGPA